MRTRTVVLAAGLTAICFSGCSCGSPDVGRLDPDGAVIGGDGSVSDGGSDDAGTPGPRDAAVDAGDSDAGVMCMAEVETCDGTDEDCDGLIDNGVFAPCGSDVGACVSGSNRASEAFSARAWVTPVRRPRHATASTTTATA